VMTADDFEPLTAEELAIFDAEEFVIEWDESWTQEKKTRSAGDWRPRVSSNGTNQI
jgi:hypothetical protein